MTTLPEISIVLPVYNGAKYLRESIDSCLAQTFRNWELIVVNDCSTDESGAIAEEYAAKDERIRIIHNETNLKLPASLNAGFRQAKGEYLTWTSDDNRYLPHALQRMIDFLQNQPKYQMVCAAFEYIDGEGKNLNRTVIPLSYPQICGNSVGACFLYTRKVYEAIGEYDTSYFLAEDYDYWLRIDKQFQMGLIKDVLYCYRGHPQSLSTERRTEIENATIELKRKYWKDYLPALSRGNRIKALVRIADDNAIDSYEGMERLFPEGLAFRGDRLVMRYYFLEFRYPICKKVRQTLRSFVHFIFPKNRTKI